MNAWILVMILSGATPGIGVYQPIGRYSTQAECQKFRDTVQTEMEKAYGKEVEGYKYVCLPTE
ncbi:MAG: hypothetical protein ACRCZI_03050 [Cetobacterium sp.]